MTVYRLARFWVQPFPEFMKNIRQVEETYQDDLVSCLCYEPERLGCHPRDLEGEGWILVDGSHQRRPFFKPEGEYTTWVTHDGPGDVGYQTTETHWALCTEPTYQGQAYTFAGRFGIRYPKQPHEYERRYDEWLLYKPADAPTG